VPMKRFIYFFLFFANFLVQNCLANTDGDYTGDGRADFTLVNIDRNADTTLFLTRSPLDGTEVMSSFDFGADAVVQGSYFAGDNRTFAGAIIYDDSNQPLRWSIDSPSGDKVDVRYGLGGDIVPNQCKFDGDDVTDFLVVRNINGTLNWFIALSASGGEVRQIPFGQNGDRVFCADMDGDGRAELGILRGEFGWIWRSLNSSFTSIVQWGLNGDIPHPPVDINGDGFADIIIFRPTSSGILQAYIRYSASNFNIFDAGEVGSVPFIGNFTGNSNSVGWVKRSQGVAGFRYHLGSGETLTFSHSVPKNIIITPVGTVFFPASSTGGGGTGGGNGEPPVGRCLASTNKGALWKPASDDTGGARQARPVFLTTNFYATGNLTVVASDRQTKIGSLGQYDYSRFYAGAQGGSGDSGSSFAAKARKVTGSPSIYVLTADGECFGPVPNAAQRYDRRKAR